jgi:hypothetical protein
LRFRRALRGAGRGEVHQRPQKQPGEDQRRQSNQKQQEIGAAPAQRPHGSPAERAGRQPQRERAAELHHVALLGIRDARPQTKCDQALEGRRQPARLRGHFRLPRQIRRVVRQQRPQRHASERTRLYDAPKQVELKAKEFARVSRLGL